LWATKPDFPIPEKKMVPVEERRVRVKSFPFYIQTHLRVCLFGEKIENKWREYVFSIVWLERKGEGKQERKGS
jgi:hypothetical protein